MGPYPTIVYIAIFKPFYKKFRTLDPQEKKHFYDKLDCPISSISDFDG